MDNLTNRQIRQLNDINTETDKMKFGAKIFEMIEAIEEGIPGEPGPQGPAGEMIVLAGTPVNAVNASKVLTISGVALDGETVTVGEDVYEFAADAALSVGEGNIVVDINSYTGKATDGLTLDTNPTIGDTMTIGTKVFTFVPNGTANADGEIDVEAALADTQANIIAAIKGTDHNDPHPLVTCDAAFLANVLAITALIGGTAGNTIATTETFTAETNIFSAATLANGSNCSKANAKIAIVAAITASDTQGVGATNEAGDDVLLTADVAGVIGNAIVIGETMSNGAFAGAAVLLSGGINGTVGEEGELAKDATYLYLCVTANTISGKNWRRIALGAAY
jgi:hypothetical protein